jgi:transketolase C-terminal domain/subunit
MAPRAVEVCEELVDRGIDVGVVDLYRVKPIGKGFSDTVLSTSQHVITLEESSVLGGVGTAVSELATELDRHVRVTRIGAADRQSIEYGSREWFHENNGLDNNSIIETITRVVASVSVR